jgi:hypothetical protein
MFRRRQPASPRPFEPVILDTPDAYHGPLLRAFRWLAEFQFVVLAACAAALPFYVVGRIVWVLVERRSWTVLGSLAFAAAAVACLLFAADSRIRWMVVGVVYLTSIVWLVCGMPVDRWLPNS